MLQKFTNTRPYAQPLSSIPANGERYTLPSDFVDGLAFLRPFVKPRGKLAEWWVHLLGGKLYIITNELIIDYEIGSNELQDVSFSQNAIRVLEAFGSPPSEVCQQHYRLHFGWDDGQEFLIDSDRGFMNHRSIYQPGRGYVESAADAFDRFLQFNDSVEISDTARREIRRMHGGAKLAKDIFLNEQEIVSRMSSDGKTWTLETSTPFLNNTDRVMRFDRKAFLGMIKIADEINFATSPVCFRHEHERGMLIEQTLGADLPDFEEVA